MARMMFGFRGLPGLNQTPRPTSLPSEGHAAATVRWSTTDFFRPHRDRRPVPGRRLLGHCTELSLGHQREQGTPSALTSRKWSSLLPEDTNWMRASLREE